MLLQIISNNVTKTVSFNLLINTFSAKIAAALLKSGKANVKKLYSPKTGKTYDGTIVLADTGGKYVNYRIEVQKN